MVDCSVCGGVTFTVDTCRCIEAGNAFIIEGERTSRGAYRDCLVCHGTGSVARGCHGCGQTGQRRAQVVLTMVNLDTGRVASANLVPGVVEPELWPEGGGWHLPVGPLIHQLAGLVGAGRWRDLVDPGRTPTGPIIFLPARLATQPARIRPPRPGSPSDRGRVAASLVRVPRPHRPHAQHPTRIVTWAGSAGSRTCSGST